MPQRYSAVNSTVQQSFTCCGQIAKVKCSAIPALTLSNARFGNQVTTESELANAGKGFVPENTQATTRWALRNFQAWSSWHAETSPDDPVPEDLLEKCVPEELDKWLSLYIMETRREDGQPFPSKSIDGLLAGLKRHMKTQNKYPPNIFSEEDPCFSNLRGTRDTVSRKLWEEGVGTSTKETELLSVEDEQVIWAKNVMGTHSPKALLCAVFFANGKNLCLRGGREHHTLKISQFVFGEVLEYVTYTEHGLKNRSGSYKDKRGNKVITYFGDKSLGERCYIFLLRTYLGRLPKCAFENDKFYWQAKQKTPLDDGSPWFAASPCGRNNLGGMMKQICGDANISLKTNHTLRATGTNVCCTFPRR